MGVGATAVPRAWVVSHEDFLIGVGNRLPGFVAWQPIPHPDEKVLVRYHPGPRNSRCPDPHAAVNLIGATAVPRAWVVSHEDFLIGVGNRLPGFVEADLAPRSTKCSTA
jgi:hypothetical protein